MTEKMKPMGLTETTKRLGDIIGRNSAILLRSKVRLRNQANEIAPPGATHFCGRFDGDVGFSGDSSYYTERIVFFCLEEGHELAGLIKLRNRPGEVESDE